jgi:putative hemolysin
MHEGCALPATRTCSAPTRGLPRREAGADPAGRRPGGVPSRSRSTSPGPARLGSASLDSRGLDSASLGRLGSLEARLARSAAEIHAAQALRYEIFYEEMAAVPCGPAAQRRRDADEFDALCDHILVLDHAAACGGKPLVIGTCRLLRQDTADLNFGFYTASEFDIAPLLAGNSLRFLELGRSCVREPYRSRRAVELLWHAVWSYVVRHRMDVMIGCASLAGTDPDRLALPLSFLHHHALAPVDWRVRARPHRYIAMDRMAKEAVTGAFRALPPLLKGYLRLGAYVGDGAVVDSQFGTTDVCMVLPVSGISRRYVDYYGADAGRHAC